MPSSRRGTVADRPPGPATRRKVKTGCRTCKLRRVKCDEGRPSCHRCVSTGRACEGYGIWGGGGGGGGGGTGHAGQALAPRTSADAVRHAVLSHYDKLSPEQEICFRWLRYRTFTKLPLPFVTPFWQMLVLQAIAGEPSILHAALALGSAHQRESLDGCRPTRPRRTLDPQQEFMLREYGRAIRALQPHFSSHGGKSVHVTLIACVLFTFTENLLGRYAIANAHLHSGLRLLAESHGPAARSVDVNVSARMRGCVDDWIIETFARLHVQAALFGQGLLEIYPRLPLFPSTPMPGIFKSSNQAATHMDRLLLDILHLPEEFSSPNDLATDSAIITALHDRRKRLRVELGLWLAAYEATSPGLADGFSPIDEFYLKVLRGYHTMATITLNTLAWPACESRYDLYTADFISLIAQLVAIWRAHVARPVWHPRPWAPAETPRRISHSVGDKGWIPLLYFVAVKCRVRRIRLQALRLLAQTVHKEGIWDSGLALLTATEVARIEEDGFYRATQEEDDGFDIVSIPSEKDVSRPPLPDHRRLYNLRVELPEHSTGILTLEYDRGRGDGNDVERRKRCYDLETKIWADVAEYDYQESSYKA
ncbi:hypothetical protein F4802DRAFT_348911 [Xylaria palmicola]|nr:hypothetical protein F4802DRAFT_348911 [Xylaria palmicola]